MIPNDISIEIQKKKIKKIYIRIRRDKTVLVTAPLSCSQTFIEDFISKKEPWIREKLSQMSDILSYRYVFGETHFVLGKPIPLKFMFGEKNGAIIRDEGVCLILYSPDVNRKKLYEAAMRDFLEHVIVDLLDTWVPKMKVMPTKITIRKMKSRWGTCNTRTGELCFALDLVTKPIECVEEVVIHELNHFLEKGHTPRFYALMAQWMPEYKEIEKRLNLFPKEFV